MRTSRTKKKHTWWILTLLIVTFSCVDVALGAGRVEYTPLVGLPGAQGTGAGGLVGYFNRLYMLVVAVGAIIAFLKIAFAGVKYSLDGVVTHKQEAKDDIKGALFGLVILLVPFIILNTIYGGLTKLNVLDVASRLQVTTNNTNTANGPAPQVEDAPRPGEQSQNMSCIFRGTLEPGTETGINGPQYTPESYDCTQQRAECTARPGGRAVVSANGQSLNCIFTPTACTPGSAGCPITSAPNYTPVNENFACASATNCTAATAQCRNFPTFMNVTSPITSGGSTYVTCTYRQNTTPVTAPDPNCNPTPESPC